MAVVRQETPQPREVSRGADPGAERLVLAVLFSAILHGVAAMSVRAPASPPSTPSEVELEAVSNVELADHGHPLGDPAGASTGTIGELASFEAAAGARIATMESQLADAIVQRAESARIEAESMADALARGTVEQTRLAEEAAALQQTLAARDAELTAAAARAAEAEQAAAEARRQAAEAAAWKAAYDDLARVFEREIAAKEVSLQRLAQGVALSISDRILFPSGAAEISPDGARMLDRMTQVLQRLSSRRARVEGHTDDVPIGPALRAHFPSNWELSTARATAVVKYLLAHGVARERLAAAGYADTRPIASNRTEAGRAQNRRIEIVVVPETPAPKASAIDRGT